MAMKSSSVCAQEPEKITKTKWAQWYGTHSNLACLLKLIAGSLVFIIFSKQIIGIIECPRLNSVLFMSVKMINIKWESQVTSPKLMLTMAAQLVYCCTWSGEEFLSETPVMEHTNRNTTDDWSYPAHLNTEPRTKVYSLPASHVSWQTPHWHLMHP